METYNINGVAIKDIQRKMLEILMEVDRICKKHDIAYVLDSGTLLGAVRHSGFIPWDDDVDIAMLRSDYDHFCRIVNEELSSKYVFENTSIRIAFPNIFGKCYDVSTRYVERSSSHLDGYHSVFLDIFPIDNINPKTKNIQCRIVSSLNAVRCIKLKTVPFAPRHILYLPLFLLPISWINKLADYTMRFYNDKDTGLVCPICQSGVAKPIFKKSMFTETILLAFEGERLPVPKEYMEYLLGYYKNPMQLPPEEKRKPTHGIVEIKL